MVIIDPSMNINLRDKYSIDGIDPSEIIAIGKAVWNFIKDNQPVVDTKTDWAGAIPKGTDPTKLSGWETHT